MTTRNIIMLPINKIKSHVSNIIFHIYIIMFHLEVPSSKNYNDSTWKHPKTKKIVSLVGSWGPPRTLKFHNYHCPLIVAAFIWPKDYWYGVKPYAINQSINRLFFLHFKYSGNIPTSLSNIRISWPRPNIRAYYEVGDVLQLQCTGEIESINSTPSKVYTCNCKSKSASDLIFNIFNIWFIKD